MSAGLIVGIDGTSLDARTREMLMHPAVVGVILFARNFVDDLQLRRLTGELRALKSPRLLLCADHEGGRVQRFRAGFTPLPPPGRIGALYPRWPDRARDMAYRYGRVMAAEVLDRGVDLSLAPVLDLDRGSEVIGDRAFSADPEVVADLARYAIAGMHDAGMKCCGKHFPGHGSVRPDSHLQTVIDDRCLEALADDLVPFERLIDVLDAVMPAHVVYTAVDQCPAGFSREWIARLRDGMGFSGVVISDDLDMAGAGVVGDAYRRWQAAAEAGCDLACICDPASALALTRRIDADEAWVAKARQQASRLYGQAMFALDEQLLVPEFRGWRESLKRMSGA
ncbi:MAG: beta-N-acetylhexosaminidase [Wenzhouxiangellaceae bacterium]